MSLACRARAQGPPLCPGLERTPQHHQRLLQELAAPPPLARHLFLQTFCSLDRSSLTTPELCLCEASVYFLAFSPQLLSFEAEKWQEGWGRVQSKFLGAYTGGARQTRGSPCGPASSGPQADRQRRRTRPLLTMASSLPCLCSSFHIDGPSSRPCWGTEHSGSAGGRRQGPPSSRGDQGPAWSGTGRATPHRELDLSGPQGPPPRNGETVNLPPGAGEAGHLAVPLGPWPQGGTALRHHRQQPSDAKAWG